jgi:hypothetical protein
MPVLHPLEQFAVGSVEIKRVEYPRDIAHLHGWPPIRLVVDF